MITFIRNIKKFKIKSLLKWVINDDKDDNLQDILGSNKLYELNGQLRFSIQYVPRRSFLTIKIIQAIELVTTNKSCNPSVVVELVIDGKQPIYRRTETKKSNSDPIFTETFVFKVSREDLYNAKLNITVDTENEDGKCIPIGKIELECQELEYQIESEWFLLLQSLKLI